MSNTKMSLEDKDPMYLDICQQLDRFCKRVEEKVNRDQQQEKLAQERKKNLEEVSSRYTELDRLWAMFPGQLTISDNDQTRLDQAKLSYEVGKELTGVRLDYTAPPHICKGYVKSESRKLLQPFNLEQSPSSEIWRLAEAGAAPEWGLQDKENLEPHSH